MPTILMQVNIMHSVQLRKPSLKSQYACDTFILLLLSIQMTIVNRLEESNARLIRYFHKIFKC